MLLKLLLLMAITCLSLNLSDQCLVCRTIARCPPSLFTDGYIDQIVEVVGSKIRGLGRVIAISRQINEDINTYAMTFLRGDTIYINLNTTDEDESIEMYTTNQHLRQSLSNRSKEDNNKKQNGLANQNILRVDWQVHADLQSSYNNISINYADIDLTCMLARQFISIIFDRFSKAQNFLKLATVATSSNEYGQFVRLIFNFSNISFSPLQYSFVFVKTVNTSTFYLVTQSYINVATNPTFTSLSSLASQNNPKLQQILKLLHQMYYGVLINAKIESIYVNPPFYKIVFSSEGRQLPFLILNDIVKDSYGLIINEYTKINECRMDNSTPNKNSDASKNIPNIQSNDSKITLNFSQQSGSTCGQKDEVEEQTKEALMKMITNRVGNLSIGKSNKAKESSLTVSQEIVNSTSKPNNTSAASFKHQVVQNPDPKSVLYQKIISFLSQTYEIDTIAAKIIKIESDSSLKKDTNYKITMRMLDSKSTYQIFMFYTFANNTYSFISADLLNKSLPTFADNTKLTKGEIAQDTRISIIVSFLNDKNREVLSGATLLSIYRTIPYYSLIFSSLKYESLIFNVFANEITREIQIISSKQKLKTIESNIKKDSTTLTIGPQTNSNGYSYISESAFNSMEIQVFLGWIEQQNSFYRKSMIESIYKSNANSTFCFRYLISGKYYTLYYNQSQFMIPKKTAGTNLKSQIRIDNCLRQQNRICVQCFYRFYWAGDKCKMVQQECSIYDRTTGRCLSCYTGYILDENNVCSESWKGDVHCIQWRGPNCNRCCSGYMAQGAKCIPMAIRK